MENPALEETKKGSSRKTRSASAKKSKRARATARPDESTSPAQLMRRGKNLFAKAEQWAGGATRLTSPLSDLGSNAIVIGVLGLGIGVAVGAMLPRMSLPDMMVSNGSAAAARSKRKGSKSAARH
jgi:hypothetical protein